MRILVTGGAGFIGSHLCERLLRAGHQVVAMDNLVTGKRENLTELEGHPGFQFIRHDITEPIQWEGPLHRIYQFASPASPVDYAAIPVETLMVGSRGAHHALGLARRTGARILLASTSEVYGDPAVHPQPESYWGNVNPIGPRSCYDEAKRFAEALTMAYQRTRGVDTRIVRIFNTYGPRMRLDDGRAIPNFLTQALRREPITVYGDGSQTRSFCYVDDLVEGILRLMESEETLPVNVGNPAELTLGEMAERIRILTGTTSPIVYRPLPEDDPKVRRPDITRARTLLGWEPQVELAEGLEKTVAFFKRALARQTV
ncbi:MAG: UDP-glucuronic acid decarboxylase family protein [Candidatus Sericytochromatia bacterium]|nr:UDP-glucuronic acid decarboxylase family protein [Candidatus Sericytochromatia bacterium]